MRRQVGAEAVRIDTMGDESVSYVLGAPRVIDFAAIEEATHDAGYTLKRVEVEVEGRVDSGPDGVFLTISETGQRLELSGETPSGGSVRVRGSVRGWASGQAVLTVMSAEAVD
ncbi:MAG: hypothetical protein O7B99_10910 [Planctomycetota bacterium]|nr:hypothetical protein [Planctomycetota bacterium]